MKKFIKVFLITFLSLIGVLIISISIVLWIVFTPQRLTPIVRKQAAKYLTCGSEIGSVELTFFSTFPDFGLKVNRLALINPVAGSQNDTLVSVNEFVGVVDAAAYWKKKEVVIKGLELNGGSVNVFSDSLGHTNYDIFKADTTTTPAPSETAAPDIDIRIIALRDVNINYNDLSLKLNSVIRNLTARIYGTVAQDSISGNINVSRSDISFEYGGEKYLQDASVQFDLPVDVILSRQYIKLRNATFAVNDLELMVDGTVENDTVGKNIITDLEYRLSSWQLKDLLALVPPSFNSYLKGVEADGQLTLQGSVRGIMNDNAYPLMDLHMLLEKGSLRYPGLDLPLHDIAGDVIIHTDLKTNSLSYVRINNLSARTPRSSFKTSGLINHLFGDIYCNLTSDAGLTLDEFNSMIPRDMKVNLKGKASGQIRSRFSMSQVEKMQIEKMKLSGSLRLSGLDVSYDSISLKSGRSKIDFALPASDPSSQNTKFVYASIVSDNLDAAKIASYYASLRNVSLRLEASDPRDTTRIPDLICTFSLDSLSAGMDDMSIAIANPHGKVAVSPRAESPDQPQIKLTYDSDQLRTMMGQTTAVLGKISTDLDILNDNTQKDIFLQWLVKGFVDINQGLVTMSELTQQIEIPSVKMDFDPETFNIKESSLKIGKSDFQLTGNLNNVLSYFRGDSLLKGNFNFVSNTTDIAQLMALTSGIGTYDSTSVNVYEDTSVDTTYTGPYMVPKRMDLVLAVNIKNATLGVDTASNITGSVQVHDGILLLDGLKFKTPAARMQLTAMYRTPRKNHLFLGLDYHMLDIEIGELLTMIPDIDSLMPMLRSFGGKGEFHIAVETYLDSLYNIKKSTLRGASSIRGNNLVLMDGETFSEIAKTLRFNKKTVNRVDSLAAEFTIFRNEIDIYPFLIVMDKYKAVVAGRHNFDMTFNYHISVVDCPLPIKLGVDVKGNMDDLSYNLAKCRYAEYFRPSDRHEVEKKQLELRTLIRQMLAEKVKEE